MPMPSQPPLSGTPVHQTSSTGPPAPQSGAMSQQNLNQIVSCISYTEWMFSRTPDSGTFFQDTRSCFFCVLGLLLFAAWELPFISCCKCLCYYQVVMTGWTGVVSSCTTQKTPWLVARVSPGNKMRRLSEWVARLPVWQECFSHPPSCVFIVASSALFTASNHLSRLSSLIISLLFDFLFALQYSWPPAGKIGRSGLGSKHSRGSSCPSSRLQGQFLQLLRPVPKVLLTSQSIS